MKKEDVIEWTQEQKAAQAERIKRLWAEGKIKPRGKKRKGWSYYARKKHARRMKRVWKKKMKTNSHATTIEQAVIERAADKVAERLLARMKI